MAGIRVAQRAAVEVVDAEHERGHGVHRAEVVDRHHFDVAAAVLDDRTQDQAADATETVDGDANRHGAGSFGFSCAGVLLGRTGEVKPSPSRRGRGRDLAVQVCNSGAASAVPDRRRMG